MDKKELKNKFNRVAVDASQAQMFAYEVIDNLGEVDSGEEPAGKVLISDGEGGAAWESPTSGGTQLYQHTLTATVSTSYSVDDYDMTFIIVNTYSGSMKNKAIMNVYKSFGIFISGFVKGLDPDIPDGIIPLIYITSESEPRFKCCSPADFGDVEGYFMNSPYWKDDVVTLL